MTERVTDSVTRHEQRRLPNPHFSPELSAKTTAGAQEESPRAPPNRSNISPFTPVFQATEKEVSPCFARPGQKAGIGEGARAAIFSREKRRKKPQTSRLLQGY